jgi:hypothetical protein
MSVGNVNFELEASDVGMGIRKVSQVITYDDFTDAGSTGTLTMTDTIPAGSFVIGSKVTVKTAFTGTSVTTCTLAIGDSGDANCYSCNTTHSIFTATTAAAQRVTAAFIASDAGLNAEAAANSILLVATDSTGDWSIITAGEMTVEVFYLSTNLELP